MYRKMGLKSRKKLEICTDHALLAYISVKEMYKRRGLVTVHFCNTKAGISLASQTHFSFVWVVEKRVW